jgi:hypothetical protein
MSIGTDICRTQSYSFDPTNIDDPVNTGVQDITNSKKSSWKIPSIRKLATGALAIQAAAMAPKAEAGPLGEILCMASCATIATANPGFIPFLPSCYLFCTGVGVMPTP